MTQFAPDASVIELGVPGAEDEVRDGPRLPIDLRHRLLIALLTMLCLFTLAASVPGRPVLGRPLWTGSVSLNGFTLGPGSLYMWRVDGKAVTALDLFTGRPRWSRDTTGLPDSIVDLGNGVAVVTTRPVFIEGAGRQSNTITLVRDASGERIAQTTGDPYEPSVASVDGRLLLVGSRRFDGPDGCGESEATASCIDLAAWNVGTGAVAWRLSLPPNARYLRAVVDGRVEALAEIDTDGTVRLRDLSTGVVTGVLSQSPEVSQSEGQVGLVHGLLLTAQRGPDGVTVAAYRPPSLNRSWSVVVADHTATNDQGAGILHLGECGPDACLMVRGGPSWLINPSTGAVTQPITFQLLQRLGGGVFLASPQHGQLRSYGTAGQKNGFIIDPTGRTVAALAATAVVDWSGSGDRALVTRDGSEQTEFRVVDDRGNVRTLGTVAGTQLTCSARADILACSDPAGIVRVWRLPL